MSDSFDSKRRFLFDRTDMRGEVANLSQSYRQILKNNDLPFSVQQLLGEMSVAACLMSGRLKFDGQLSIQAQGNGPVSMIMAECSHHASVRSIARLNDDVDPACLGEAPDIRSMLGESVLVITIDPDKGERYQGIVPLDQPTLAECLEQYFQQSEQLDTRFWLSADQEHAGGLMLQRLPNQESGSEEELLDHWETATALANTVKPEELRSLPHEQLLHRLFHEMDVMSFDPQPLRFECSCSRERSANALKSLGRGEVASMMAESSPIDINCQFCNALYRFDESDLDELFSGDLPHIH